MVSPCKDILRLPHRPQAYAPSSPCCVFERLVILLGGRVSCGPQASLRLRCVCVCVCAGGGGGGLNDPYESIYMGSWLCVLAGGGA